MSFRLMFKICIQIKYILIKNNIIVKIEDCSGKIYGPLRSWVIWSLPSISLVVPGLYKSIVPNTFVCTFGDTPKVDL